MLRFIRPVAALLVMAHAAIAAETQPSLALRLEDAIAEALQHSPALASAKAQVNASLGDEQQAGALPNPEIGVEAENVGGGGPYSGFGGAEITYGLSQQIELGGKRSARQQAAHYSQDIAVLNAEAARLDVIRDVTAAYAAAVAAQETQRFAEEQHRIASEELKSVSRRVAEAASPVMQKSKAEISVATSQFAVQEARQEAQLARGQLAALVGRPRMATELDSADFFAIGSPAAMEESTLKTTPDIVRWEHEKKRAQSMLELEKAGAIPDPKLSLGVRQFRDTNDNAFVLGVAMPIPVFNGNSGNIQRAHADVSRTESDQRLALLEREQEFARKQSELNNAYAQATSLRDTVIPAAEKAFEQSRYGYGAGKFPYLEVLDAQRTLFDARHQYITALRNYHTSKAELERIAGTHAQETKGALHD